MADGVNNKYYSPQQQATTAARALAGLVSEPTDQPTQVLSTDPSVPSPSPSLGDYLDYLPSGYLVTVSFTNTDTDCSASPGYLSGMCIWMHTAYMACAYAHP